jgi:translation elongation factor P/translation initiation factor 5A
MSVLPESGQGSAVVTNEIERGNTVVIAGDSLAIDDTGARAYGKAGSIAHYGALAIRGLSN